MAVYYTFGNATSAIPLSQLDNNFATPVTIGNVAIQLGNTVATLSNLSLSNVTIASTLTAGGTTGNVGQFLTSNGSGNVYWSTSSGGGGGSNVAIGLVRAISINCILP